MKAKYEVLTEKCIELENFHTKNNLQQWYNKKYQILNSFAMFCIKECSLQYEFY